jgi:FkbM family methyltransferase
VEDVALKAFIETTQKEMDIMSVADQTVLMRLGLISRLLRLVGMGALLQLTRDLLDHIFLKVKKFPLKAHIDGHVIYGCLRHRSFLHHISVENYEPLTIELFKKHLRPGMTVIDGGAHIGLFTLLAARLVGPNGRVFSFEPDPYNFQCLAFNVEQNSYHNVTTVQKLIADRIGNAIFYQSSGTISSSLGNRNENSNFFKGTSVKKLDVQSTTLDAELDEIPADVIKLDIEGAEPLAVQGMNKIIQKGHPLVLFAEINPSALTSLGSSPELLIRSLRNLGFDVYFIDESKRGLIPLSENSAISKGNLYCKLGDSR